MQFLKYIRLFTFFHLRSISGKPYYILLLQATTPSGGNTVITPSSAALMGYPHRLSASTVAVVCSGRAAASPQAAGAPPSKGNDAEYYLSNDPNCLPPPPLSSGSQVSQTISSNECTLNASCTCLSTANGQLEVTRFPKTADRNGTDQRVSNYFCMGNQVFITLYVFR